MALFMYIVTCPTLEVIEVHAELERANSITVGSFAVVSRASDTEGGSLS